MPFHSGRGGYRGGGRPVGTTKPPEEKKVKVSMYLPFDIVEFLKKQRRSQAKIVEEALREIHEELKLKK